MQWRVESHPGFRLSFSPPSSIEDAPLVDRGEDQAKEAGRFPDTELGLEL
jgi:hypothetical protein